MIVKELPPISWASKIGFTDHGVLFERQVDGVKSYKLLIGGDEVDLPSSFSTVPFRRRLSHVIRRPGIPAIDMPPEVLADELAAGRAWLDFATLAGANGVFYGQSIGNRSWIALLPDGYAWQVAIARVGSAWRMVFSRWASGPVGATGARSFSINLVNDSGGQTNHFTASTASVDGSSTWPYYTLLDVSNDGNKAILRATGYSGVGGAFGFMPNANAIMVRLPTLEDFAAWSIDLGAVSGHVDGANFDPVIDNVSTGALDTFYSGQFSRTYLRSETQARPMYSYSVAVSEGLDILESDIGVGGDMSIIPGDPFYTATGVWGVYDFLPKPITWQYELVRKAHVAEDGSTIQYRVTSSATCTVSSNGPLVSGSETGMGPPPVTAGTEVYFDWVIDQTIEYGANTWTGSGSYRDTMPASLYYSTAGSGPSFSEGVWRVAPPNVHGAFKPYICFYAAPENLVDTGASDPATWNIGYYDYSAYAIADGSTDGREFSSPLMHAPDRAGVEFGEWFPAVQSIPVGTYLKGQFVSSWLPKHDVTWCYDHALGVIVSRSRPSTESSDGYISAIYV